jgi:hypothetical protein
LSFDWSAWAATTTESVSEPFAATGALNFASGFAGPAVAVPRAAASAFAPASFERARREWETARFFRQMGGLLRNSQETIDETVSENRRGNGRVMRRMLKYENHTWDTEILGI